MEEKSESLILAAGSANRDQPTFFPEFQGDAYEIMERKGEFTGERLFSQDRARYDFIVELIADGTLSTSQIAKACKVSRNTVAAVREREKIPIEHVKERILKGVRTGMLLTIERINELAPTAEMRDAVIGFGVLAEKHQLLSGEATVIVHHVEERIKHTDFNDLVDSLPQANAREIGSSASAARQKGELAAPAPTDTGSDAIQKAPVKSNGQGNNSPDDRTTTPGLSSEGGRGFGEAEGDNQPN